MAPKKSETSTESAAMLDGKQIEEMSLEELQMFNARNQALAGAYQLDNARADHAKRVATEAERKRSNTQRMKELGDGRANRARVHAVCRHRQGGFRKDVLKGNGPGAVSKTRMPDGVTYRLYCNRCRLEVFTPHDSLAKSDPKEFARLTVLYSKLNELWEGSGLDEMQTPVFSFKQDGVPFIPIPGQSLQLAAGE